MTDIVQNALKIRVKTRQIKEFVDQRVCLRIDEWNEDSQYPAGHYVSTLGRIDDIDTETRALLIEHDIHLPLIKSSNVEEEGFSNQAMAKLPRSIDEWTGFSPSEIENRRDLRSTHLVMSIDPPGCEDIDDALSFHRIDDNTFVSSFLSPSNIDKTNEGMRE